MLIICRGAKKYNKIEKCTFLYDGTWGDPQLIEHQKHHQSLEGPNYTWLGFDTPQSLGYFSGRDGKRR
ncbi:MAG: hypothetical protein ACE5RF_00965 [Nitrosarchaeum sp.]